jgi:transposase-like protein
MGKHGNSKFTEPIKNKIYQALMLGSTYKLAANYAGISESTLYYWLDRAKQQEEGEYYDFIVACREAEAQGALNCLGTLNNAISQGNLQAAMFLLERRHRYEKNLSPEANIEINIDISESNVPELVEQIKEQALQEVILGPVIDLDEE